MRDWSLGSGDPLSLTLAADARLCTPDYFDDHIWELEIGNGEPAALALYTTYGLRARAMRIFPRFAEDGRTVSDPAEFAAPPRVRRFYPNFLLLDFSPLPDLNVTAEYWAPDSHTVACRLTIANRTAQERAVRLDVCGVLVPLKGRSLAPRKIQSVHILSGETGDLTPVLFLTGGPHPGPGPYPSLSLDLNLGPGARRQLTWVQVALADVGTAFDAARHAAARPWDAERARIELLNAGQTVDIRTGDPDWDAALALSQKVALSLFLRSDGALPYPSFVLARQADHGYSPQGEGSDYRHLWGGQSPLDAYYLLHLLPGAPHLVEGLLHNFLSTQGADGFVDGSPGLGGQRGHFLAAPLLATLAWRLYSRSGDEAFLRRVFSPLLAFCRAWFAPAHDRDGDGFPEWDHPLQSGYEDNPLFTSWYAWSQGLDIRTVESPSLAAFLYRECQSLSAMAGRLGQTEALGDLPTRARALRQAIESCWNARSGCYRYRDRETHLRPAGKVLARLRGPGTVRLKQTFEPPVRLVIQIVTRGKTTPRPEVAVCEYVTRAGEDELLSPQAFQWRADGAVATTQKVFSRIGKIVVRGVRKSDRVVVRTADYTAEDHTLFAPLWAGAPEMQRAQTLIGRSLLDASRFDRPFGVPACPVRGRGRYGGRKVPPQAGDVCLSVHMPWNALIIEGLLRYGFRKEAARLFAHLMTGVVQSLKRNRAFYQRYHAEVGEGMGERNALQGLIAPGLFLLILGVEFLSGGRVRLEGRNPFPWPVTVQYRGVTVSRYAGYSEVTYPDGRKARVDDPARCVVAPNPDGANERS